MRTDDLISQLTVDSGPVRRLPAFSHRLAFFLGLGGMLTLSTLLRFGVRKDLSVAMTQLTFQLETVALLFVFLWSTRAALVLSVPGQVVSGGQQRVLWSLIALAVGSLAIASAPGLSAAALVHSYHGASNCTNYVSGVGALHGLFFLWYLRRAAPLYPLRTGALALLASGSLCAFTVHFLCKSEAPLHLLIGHYLPLVVLCGAGLVLGQLFFSHVPKTARP